MEGRRVKRLKRTMRPVAFDLLLFLLTTALLLAMTPLAAMGTSAYVEVDTYPGPGFSPGDVTINVGESVHWQHIDLSSAPHWIKSGDYEGRPCYDNTFVGGDTGNGSNTDGLLSVHEDAYIHFFPSTGGDCYYKCIIFVGMEGVVHVLGPGGTTTTTRPTTTTTTTTTRPTTTTTTTTTRPTTTTTTTTTRPTTTTTTTTTLPTTTTTTTTTLPNQAPSAVSLTPVNITTAPSVAQTFTAVYSDPNGYQNIADMSLLLSGSTHNELVHFSPTTNKFTMMGVGGDCSPGQAATLSDGNLTLNCSTSSVSGSGAMWSVTYNLTPLPPLSGTAYVLVIAVTDLGSLSNNKTVGTWTVNRPPSADSVSPMNGSTPPGTVQIFTAGYSDPDGWQNIAAANFYLSGNGGAHIEWLHYLVAPNLFTMLGTNDVCSPGQAITISNGFLSLDCGASSISGSGTVLTVTFRVTPQAPSSGIQYLIFTATSDQAGAANAIFAGNWGIQ